MTAVLAALAALVAAVGPALGLREVAPRVAAVVALAAAVAGRRPARAIVAQVLCGAGMLATLVLLLLATPQAGAAAQGLRALTWSAGVVLSAWLCVHLRAALVRARLWASLLLFVPVALAAARVSDADLALSAVAAASLVVAALLVTRLGVELAGLLALWQPASIERVVSGDVRSCVVVLLGVLVLYVPLRRFAVVRVLCCAAAAVVLALEPEHASDAVWLLCVAVPGAPTNEAASAARSTT